MYTNNYVVWNNQFDTIYKSNIGGTYNHIGASQTLLLPHPGNSNIYFYLNVPYHNYMGGIRYTEIDLSMNGGAGGWVWPNNHVLLSPNCQKVTAVYHANGKDIWVMLHEFNSDAFHAILLTENGFSPTAVVSHVGTVHAQPANPQAAIPFASTYGEMKLSTNGKRLALAVFELGFCEVFDFDNTTGIVSNPIKIMVEGAEHVEFSPDGTIVYIGNEYEYGTLPPDITSIYQIDLLAGDSSDIVNSKLKIDVLSCSGYGSLRSFIQLAPDGKIYNVKLVHDCDGIDYMNHISAILSPNTVGLGCNWVVDELVLPPSYCGYGYFESLPNFFRSALDRNIVIENTCYGDTSFICTQTNTDFDSICWEFENVAAGLEFYVANQDTVYHVFSQPGTYNIVLKRYRNGLLDADKRMLTILPSVNIDLGNDSLFCEGTYLSVGNQPFCEFAWLNNLTQDSVFTDSILITQTGTYWPVLTNHDEYCGSTDTATVSSYLPDSLFIGKDTSGICISNPITLDATIDSTLSLSEAYTWNTGDTTASILANQSGFYWVDVQQGFCTFTDTISVTYEEPLSVGLPDTVFLCDSLPEIISTGDFIGHPEPVGIIWAPYGETTPEITIETAGIYSVTASNACGGFSDSTKAVSLQTPTAWFGNDTIICLGGQIQFAIQNQQLANYFWSTGASDTSIIVDEQGDYWLIVNNTCGGDTNHIFLTIHENTLQFATDTLFILKGDSITLSGPGSTLSVAEVWSTNETTPSITVSEFGTYFLTVTDKIGCMATDSITVAQKDTGSGILPFQDILIYPNPFSDELTIFGLQGNEEIRVLDVLGRKIQLSSLVKENWVQLNFKGQAYGLYFIYIKRGKELKVVKVVKE